MPRPADPRPALGTALVVLLVVAAATTIPRLQHALERDAVRRLAAELGATGARPGAAALVPFGISAVRVEGHHVTIRGVPRSTAEAARLEAVIIGDGIATAHYEVDPAARLSDDGTAGVDVTVERRDGLLVLRGRVQSDAQRTTLQSAAEFAYGRDRVRTTLTVVSAGPRDPVVDERVSALALFVTNATRADAVEVRLAPRSLTVRASVPDAATRDLLRGLADAIGEGAVGERVVDIRAVDVPTTLGVAVEPATTVR